MRVLICPDKFKGSMTAAAAADAMARGVRRVLPDAEITLLPIADGGEGTAEVALAVGASRRTTTVQGPLGRPVEAMWTLDTDGSAVIESAGASGLALVTPSPQTALDAHSHGVGELIGAALDAGARHIVLGLGGSAMTDGGSGALVALGARITDAQGDPLPLGGRALGRAAHLDVSDLHPGLLAATIVVACDVDNPLTGPSGAAAVFGPQKGADPTGVAALDAALIVWRNLLAHTGGRTVEVPGTGAAGGLAAPFVALCNASIRSGFDVVDDLLGLTDAILSADLVITGEGSLDEQSLGGKGPVAVARAALFSSTPALGIAGRVTLTAEQETSAGFEGTMALTDLVSLDEALRRPGTVTEDATASLVSAWRDS